MVVLLTFQCPRGPPRLSPRAAARRHLRRPPQGRPRHEALSPDAPHQPQRAHRVKAVVHARTYNGRDRVTVNEQRTNRPAKQSPSTASPHPQRNAKQRTQRTQHTHNAKQTQTKLQQSPLPCTSISPPAGVGRVVLYHNARTPRPCRTTSRRSSQTLACGRHRNPEYKLLFSTIPSHNSLPFPPPLLPCPLSTSLQVTTPPHTHTPRSTAFHTSP